MPYLDTKNLAIPYQMACHLQLRAIRTHSINLPVKGIKANYSSPNLTAKLTAKPAIMNDYERTPANKKGA